ncbi:unnamed protein product, partial [marine sediment metagenome]
MLSLFKSVENATYDVGAIITLLESVFCNFRSLVEYFCEIFGNDKFSEFLKSELDKVKNDIGVFLSKKKETIKLDDKVIEMISKEEREINNHDILFCELVNSVVNQEKKIAHVVGLKITEDVELMFSEIKGILKDANIQDENCKYLIMNLNNSIFKTGDKCH